MRCQIPDTGNGVAQVLLAMAIVAPICALLVYVVLPVIWPYLLVGAAVMVALILAFVAFMVLAAWASL